MIEARCAIRETVASKENWRDFGNVPSSSGQDMHGPPHDLGIRAFVAFIKAEGAEALVDCLLRNEAHGIQYGHGRDYDGKNSEEEVIRLLKIGLSD